MFGYKYVAIQMGNLSYLSYRKYTGLDFFFSCHLHDSNFKTSEPFIILYCLDFATVNFLSAIANTQTYHFISDIISHNQ